MTNKKEFDEYNGLLHCRACGMDVPKIHTTYDKVNKDFSVTRCNVCAWLKRHRGLPVIEGYTEQEVMRALRYYIYEESPYVNGLADELGKTVEDAIALYHGLGLEGKKCFVKCNCEYCGKEVIYPPSVYLQRDHYYCNQECYWADMPSKIPKGKNSPWYNRVTVKCAYCGDELKIIPYNLTRVNSNGESNHFCNRKCLNAYKSIHYSGENHPMWNYQYSDEQLDRMRVASAERLKSMNRLDSKIQLSINAILDKYQILYEREYTLKYYSMDNFLIDSGLMIEVMGDYWHANPLRYNEEKHFMNLKQKDGIHRDKLKYSYVKSHYDVEILYLWETDINKRPDVCEKLILKYIDNKGILSDYNSFNWEIKNDILCLKDNIILPYQKRDIETYRHLFVA